MAKLASVYILDLTYNLDVEYTYYVPDHIQDLARGVFCIVPFGNGNRKLIALCTKVFLGTPDEKTKGIIQTISYNFTFDDETISLIEYVKKITFCTIGDVVKRIIPCDGLSKAIDYYFCVENVDISILNQSKQDLYLYILNNGPTTLDDVLKHFDSKQTKKHVKELEKDGFLKSQLVIKEKRVDAKEIFVKKNDILPIKAFSNKKTAETYKKIYSRVSESNLIPIDELQNEGFSHSHIKAMEKQGYIKFEEHEKLRIPYSNFIPEKKDISLTLEQQKALKSLSSLSDRNVGCGALLYGVTGSGKSRVILELCKYITSKGKTAIILVPEIALTWQSVEMYMQVYGLKLAVIHSALSDGERFDAFKRIKRGDVSVVLGTRSAIFAPIKNLGLIVIDEEQEHTYKSETTPKFHASDIAKLKVKQSSALLVLASATPSIETFYRAQKGIYSLVSLPNRFNGNSLPNTIISDMRNDEIKGNSDDNNIIGRTLQNLLIDNYNNCKQSVVLLNRRGYSSCVICHKCGSTITCPNCSSGLTYHKSRNGGFLMCHLCGYKTPMVKLCPTCQSEHISYEGFGTQSLEDNILSFLPNAKVIRMDADSVKEKYSRDEIVSSFAKGNYDILIGTQMIAKGHNFPYVTLSSCVGIDSCLYSNDFRANERTFDLLTQLEGRSGRSDELGKALIQTFSPNSEIIRLAKKQDYIAFYNSEIALRKSFTFPPFCDIAIITFQSEDEESVIDCANDCHEYLNKITLKSDDVPMQIFGPFECPIYKLKNKYRLRIVIKHKFNDSSRLVLNEVYTYALKNNKNVSIGIDINPTQT